jgi:hypothetical protein
LSEGTSKRKLSIYRKILYISVLSIPIWFFVWMLSIQLLHSKYEYMIPIIMGIGLLLGVIGKYVVPDLQSEISDEDVKATVDNVKDWEPVVTGQLSISGKNLDSVYDKTIEWLE